MTQTSVLGEAPIVIVEARIRFELRLFRGERSSCIAYSSVVGYCVTRPYVSCKDFPGKSDSEREGRYTHRLTITRILLKCGHLHLYMF